jgi:hypothetical protein
MENNIELDENSYPNIPKLTLDINFINNTFKNNMSPFSKPPPAPREKNINRSIPRFFYSITKHN